MILDPLLVGTNCREKLADLIDKFKDEYGEFTSKGERYSKDNIWIVASKPDTQGFRWYAKYSFGITEVLGKLACLVLSKHLRGREELEAGKEGEEGRLHQNRSQQNIKTSLD